MMRRIGWGLLLACAGVAAAPLPAESIPAPSRTPLTLADSDAIVDVSAPAISPDGRLIAFVATRVDREANERHDELVTVATQDGRQRVIARSRGTIGAPAWSPDGKKLAWTAADGADIARIHLVGINDTDAVSVRDANAAHGGVQRFAWSPDGRAIAFIAKQAAGKKGPDRSFESLEADYLGTSFLARGNGMPPPKVWITAMDASPERSLDIGEGFATDLAWRPDGKAVLVSLQPGASMVSARLGSLLSLPVDGAPPQVVIPAPAFIGSGARIRASGDGALAFQHFRGLDPWTEVNNVAVYDGAGVRVPTEALDRQIDDFRWLSGSQGLLVRGADRTRDALWSVTRSGKVSAVDLGGVNAVAGIDTSAKGAIAFVGSTAASPAEIYYMASLKARPVRLTAFNETIAGRRFGKTETVSWKNGGFDHYGVVIYPPSYDKSRKYPLLVDIHGGPEASSTEAFDFSSQFYAANGWIVFRPNYRGSTGQSNAYQTAIVGDILKGSGDDIIAGIESLQSTLSVDPKRIAISGWSWGGVMTSWLIGHDKRWCAAIPGALAINFIDYYDHSEFAIWISTLLGSPHLGDNDVKYRAQSPVTYLKNAVTPTLIIHNAGDPNAPVTQAYSLHHILKDRGIKTRLLLRDLDEHEYGDPFSYRQVHEATMSWLGENCAEPKR